MLPKLHISWERWKWNEQYSCYVSNLGKVRDKHKHPCVIGVDYKGYSRVIVPNDNGNSVLKLHTLVMETWRPLLKDVKDMTVDHLDRNKRNNTVRNLEWVTAEENNRRAKENTVGDNGLIVFKSKKSKPRPKPIAVKITNKDDKSIILKKDTNFNTYKADFCLGQSCILSTDKVNKIVKDILDQTNSAGMKKKYGYSFQAIYEEQNIALAN